MFEVLCLARQLKTPQGDQIAGLVDDVIGVALADPDAWLKFKELAGNEYGNTIFRLESAFPVNADNQ